MFIEIEEKYIEIISNIFKKKFNILFKQGNIKVNSDNGKIIKLINGTATIFTIGLSILIVKKLFITIGKDTKKDINENCSYTTERILIPISNI